MKGSKFAFHSIDLLHYKFHKTCLNHGRSYIDSPEWLKNKKSTINSKHNDDNCFQYAVTVALTQQNIKYNPKRVSNINPFIDQYYWEEIEFPSRKNDWKKYEKITTELLLMYYMFLIILKK